LGLQKAQALVAERGVTLQADLDGCTPVPDHICPNPEDPSHALRALHAASTS
jgi:hypothetical protein